MRPLELAQKYMEIFFLGEDMEALRPLFADDLSFSGPFFQFDTAEDYIVSLKADPPIDFQYKILQSFEDETSVCLVYEFSKPGICIPMVQIFEVDNDKINKILLVFDTGAFT